MILEWQQLTVSDLIQKRNPTESQSRFIKDLKIAKDQGTVSPEEYSKIRNIMTSDDSMKSKVLAVSKILNK